MIKRKAAQKRRRVYKGCKKGLPPLLIPATFKYTLPLHYNTDGAKDKGGIMCESLACD
ncbi:hypothetical protein [Caloranaerobacter sp. DY30410]|uniref:hypothetical protein n=1 Tax=Caloranaerobacter sp. DY30410 TaxID=3238305 RepID=UPI003D04E04A